MIQCSTIMIHALSFYATRHFFRPRILVKLATYKLSLFTCCLPWLVRQNVNKLSLQVASLTRIRGRTKCLYLSSTILMYNLVQTLRDLEFYIHFLLEVFQMTTEGRVSQYDRIITFSLSVHIYFSSHYIHIIVCFSLTSLVYTLNILGLSYGQNECKWRKF